MHNVAALCPDREVTNFEGNEELARRALHSLLTARAASDVTLFRHWINYMDSWRPSAFSLDDDVRRISVAAARLRVFLEALLKWWIHTEEGKNRPGNLDALTVGPLLEVLEEKNHLPERPVEGKGTQSRAARWKQAFDVLDAGAHDTGVDKLSEHKLRDAEKQVALLVYCQEAQLPRGSGHIRLRPEECSSSRPDFTGEFQKQADRAREAASQGRQDAVVANDRATEKPGVELFGRAQGGATEVVSGTSPSHDARRSLVTTLRSIGAVVITVAAAVGAISTVTGARSEQQLPPASGESPPGLTETVSGSEPEQSAPEVASTDGSGTVGQPGDQTRSAEQGTEERVEAIGYAIRSAEWVIISTASLGGEIARAHQISRDSSSLQPAGTNRGSDTVESVEEARGEDRRRYNEGLILDVTFRP